VLRRTPAILDRLATLTDSDRLRDPLAEVKTQQPTYITEPLRSLKEEYLVVIAICTHLGCVPLFRPELGSVTDDCRAATSAPATAPSSTSPAACSRRCRHRSIWRFRRTVSCPRLESRSVSIPSQRHPDTTGVMTHDSQDTHGA
jgi:hypothetical protein